MKKYLRPTSETYQIEESSILIGSAYCEKCAYSYHSRMQANEIRKLSEHMYSSITHKQKLGLMGIMSNFALEAGGKNADVCKAFEFYIISIGFTENDMRNTTSRSFDTIEEMISCVKTISNRKVHDCMIITACGFVRKANTDSAWGLFQYVCEGLGYTERDIENLVLTNNSLTNHIFG